MKKILMTMRGVFLFLTFAAMTCSAEMFPISPTGTTWDQAGLEKIVCNNFYYDDNPPDPPPPYVPLRNRDALADFRLFIERSGWTTNQFVEGLVKIANGERTGMHQWEGWEEKLATGNAVWKLSEINHPAVTNYFRELIATQSVDWVERLGTYPVYAMFCYTNLEPEVLDYMKSLCCRTNLYEKLASHVVFDMLETLRTMPSELQPAATNRLAKYMHYAIRHTTDVQGLYDRKLASFLPSYSNSIQRLEAMRYVAATATNTWESVNAAKIVLELSSLPTNQLNDVSWIAEE